MSRLALGLLLALASTTLVAWRLGGVLAGGVWLGGLAGAGIAGLCVLWQKHVLATQPRAALKAVMEGFLAKLAALLIGALALRYVEVLAERADWRAFAVSFAGAACVVLALGLSDLLRPLSLKGTRA